LGPAKPNGWIGPPTDIQECVLAISALRGETEAQPISPHILPHANQTGVAGTLVPEAGRQGRNVVRMRLKVSAGGEN
jgi:hypothetical protein